MMRLLQKGHRSITESTLSKINEYSVVALKVMVSQPGQGPIHQAQLT